MNELILMKTEEQLLSDGYHFEIRNGYNVLTKTIKGAKFTISWEMMKSLGKPLLISYGYFQTKEGGINLIDDSMFVKFLDINDYPEFLL